MKIKPVVKVMNFHALLRVESSRTKATKYAAMEKELADMIRIILSNENLRLDKKIKLPDPSLPALNIYIGSDYGFCGAVNSYVSKMASSGTGTKVVIGKKVKGVKNAEKFFLQEEVNEKFSEIQEILQEAVIKRKWSSVNLIFNNFNDITSIEQVKKKIYPLDISMDENLKNSSNDDFTFESDEVKLLNELFIAYLEYEVKIAIASSYASENIMRQNSTTEALKKIDEIEEEEAKQARKEKTQISFKKTIDSFVNQKALRQQ